MSCNGKCACGGVEQTVSIHPGVVNYCVVRGDGFSDTFTIKEAPTKDATPESVDLTDPLRSYTGQLRKSANATEVIHDIVFDMSDAADGVVIFSIPSSVTANLVGEYHYDIEQVIEPSGEPRTILAGTITFSPDVTR